MVVKVMVMNKIVRPFEEACVRRSTLSHETRADAARPSSSLPRRSANLQPTIFYDRGDAFIIRASIFIVQRRGFGIRRRIRIGIAEQRLYAR